jgi:peptidoglycan/LPS O-acetylase OafA/YrhL
MAVMVYHGQPSWLPGGFLGVDVFFVISGFLITTLLVRERTQLGDIDLPGFWMRRARRLLPAIAVVVAAVGVYALLLADATVLDRIRSDGISALLYVNNWSQIIEGTSYFGAVDPSPLRHTWSLAIEEQFYLVWPLLLIGALHLSKGKVRCWAPVAVVAALASAAAMALLSSPGADPTRAYYGTDTRAQALLIGAALAFALHGTEVRGWARWAVEVGGLVGLMGLILVGLTVSDADHWMYDGGFLLVAVFSALVVAATAQPLRRSNLAGLALALPVLAAIGRISYGLYLWHWPVDVVLSSERTGLGGVALFALRSAVTLGVAAVSYRLIERPVRMRSFNPRQMVGGFAAAVLATTAIVFVGTSGGSGLAGTGDGEIGTGDLRLLLVGDSVAYGVGANLPSYLEDDVTLFNGALIGCGITPGDPAVVPQGERFAQEVCPDRLEIWQDLTDDFDQDVALLFTGPYEVFATEVDGEVLEPGTPAFASYYQRSLEEDIATLSTNGADVMILTAFCMAERGLSGPGSPERNDVARVRWLNTQVAAVAARNPDVRVADLFGRLCPGGQHAETLDGVSLYTDGMHFTPAGATLVWDWLADELAVERSSSTP